jgi:L-ascorbate metabolism protein UlaG (beta-lactamase superfamily)
MQITWLGHASFKIVSKKGFVIYIDPFAGDNSEYSQKADLVLISHEGYHHLSYEKERMIKTDTTVVLSTQQVAYEVTGTPISPGETQEIGEVKIKAVHAYSTRPGIGREKGKSIGFMISLEGKIIYFADSTGLIPEMSEIFCDIALLPVATTTTMTPQQALEAVKLVKPKVAIPMHWGVHGGNLDEAELFKELVEDSTNTKVDILEPGQTVEF